MPPTTRNKPNAAIGYIQLPGLSGKGGIFFRCLLQFLRSKVTSQTSNMHPTATTIPEIQTPLNHLALMASSPNLIGSGASDDPYMKERKRSEVVPYHIVVSWVTNSVRSSLHLHVREGVGYF